MELQSERDIARKRPQARRTIQFGGGGRAPADEPPRTLELVTEIFPCKQQGIRRWFLIRHGFFSRARRGGVADSVISVPESQKSCDQRFREDSQRGSGSWRQDSDRHWRQRRHLARDRTGLRARRRGRGSVVNNSPQLVAARRSGALLRELECPLIRLDRQLRGLVAERLFLALAEIEQ